MGNREPAFDFELVKFGPAALGLAAGLLGDRLGHDEGGSTGVDQEIERPFPVDLYPHHDVFGLGEPERNFVCDRRLLGRWLLVVGKSRRQNQREESDANQVFHDDSRFVAH